MKRILLMAIVAITLLIPSPVAAEDSLTVTAKCNGKWVNVSHGADLSQGLVYFSRDNSYFYGPVVLSGFVPDIGGGYASVDYDVDIFVEMRDGGSLTGYNVLAKGQVRTPTCAETPRPTTAPEKPVVTIAPPLAIPTPVAPPQPAVEDLVSSIPFREPYVG